MFKWFAPLLLFAGKPETLVRIVTVVAAGAIAAFGVWLFSNVALTFDALKNPYIAATYGVVLFCFFIGIATVTWLRLRRLASAPRLSAPKSQPLPPPLPNEIVTRRAEQMSRTWARDKSGSIAKPRSSPIASPAAAAPVTPKPVGRTARGSLTVTGPAFSGKTGLIAGLVAATSANPPEASDIVRLVDAGSVDDDPLRVAALIERAATTDGVLFVVDQDLRAPEVAAITRLIASAKPLYVVLNKADQFGAADRDAILVSIRAKMPVTFASAHVVSVASAPSAVEREIEDARGAVRLELRRPPSDIRALTKLLSRAFPLPPGRTLRFEAA
jgi:hypothetical protein